MIQAGMLRDVITIQRPVGIQDTLGQPDSAYQNLYENVRAKIYPLSGHEYVAAQQVAADISTRILMRRLPKIDSTCRIIRTIEEDSPPTVEVYDVQAVLPDNVSGLRYLNLMCVQRIQEGWRRGDDPVVEEFVKIDDPTLHVDDQDWGVDTKRPIF